MEPLVHFERDGEIARITFDSPHNRNALSKRLLTEFHAALNDCVGVRVIVIDHTGTVFSSGADLHERSVGVTDSTDLVQAMERLASVDVPVIGVVRGAVRAGGMGLVASCDLVVAHPDSTFACPEVRVGVAPAIISVPLIQRCGWANLAEAMLTGRTLDADRAAAIGLVSMVASDVDGEVEQLTRAVLSGAPGAVAQTKRLLRGQPASLAEMQELSDALFAGEEAAEGMRAFNEKRPPAWAPR